MKFKYALFDLDGTLTDPAEGITNSVQFALEKFGKQVSDKKELYCFIGPPLLETFEKYCGFTKAQSQDALKAYREYFSPKGIFENVVYPGIEELLIRLNAAGVKLYVATSKPEEFSIQIMEHFGLARYFDFIGGSTMDETRVHKDEVIHYVLENAGISDFDRAVMIGDRDLDIIGAKKCGLASIGVLYGYGSRHELQLAGPDYLAEKPGEIGDIILNA